MENCNCTVSYTRPCEGCPNAPKPGRFAKLAKVFQSAIIEDYKNQERVIDTMKFYHVDKWDESTQFQRRKNYKRSASIERMCNRGN